LPLCHPQQHKRYAAARQAQRLRSLHGVGLFQQPPASLYVSPRFSASKTHRKYAQFFRALAAESSPFRLPGSGNIRCGNRVSDTPHEIYPLI
jgi:hypothetical protein